ncbi:phage terminase large subunit family protein [Azotobacter vinelandii]
MSLIAESRSLSREERAELLLLLEEKKRRRAQQASLIQFQTLYDWQLKFIEATASYSACMLMAANRVGKTRTGLTIDAFHLLGDYPTDWAGHKFTGAPLCWLLGFSMEKTRDLLQVPLFGRMEGGKFTGGLIPADRIVDWKSATGTSGAMREVRVRHASGGIAIVQFWSYSQGQHAIMGDSVDWYHIDEEPRDSAIYPQVITRTATGDQGRGGRGILTFTPENGRTELVVQFMDSPAASQYMQRATWDDAKHLTEETKQALLDQYPAWQRDMRTKGLPLLGTGLIFDFGDDLIKCAPFPCPDHFWVINGMDFGWDHPQAHVQLWGDMDADVIYVAHAWKQSRTTPATAWGVVKPWAKNVPTAWPSDGLQSEKSSGEQQMAAYKDAGWTMLAEHATWPAGGVGVEAGLVELYERMTTGRLKVFSHLSPWFEEKMNYHRDELGRIVKLNDDLLSATRYAYMMRRFARQRYQIKAPTTGTHQSNYDPFA